MPRFPYNDSSAGCNVAAAAIETSGMRNPATPSIRTNGSGIAIRSASPIATVAPEKTTARPAVSIVRTIASSLDAFARRSSRKRETTSSE